MAEPTEGGTSIVHLAEAIESKHRVRERLVRALAQAPEQVECADARPFDPADADMPTPDSGLGLERNPLGEYLLQCELQRRPFGL